MNRLLFHSQFIGWCIGTTTSDRGRRRGLTANHAQVSDQSGPFLAQSRKSLKQTANHAQERGRFTDEDLLIPPDKNCSFEQVQLESRR
jgi:hypothetical protein